LLSRAVTARKHSDTQALRQARPQPGRIAPVWSVFLGMQCKPDTEIRGKNFSAKTMMSKISTANV
jgi:hypothetical protein